MNKSYVLAIVFFCALGGFLFGYQTAIIAGALSFLQKQFSLSVAGEGLAVSMILIGALFGSLFGGTLADRWGRRYMMILSAAFFLLGTLLVVMANAFDMFLCGRAMTGVAVGVTGSVAPMYIAEVSPKQQRGAFVSSYQLAITVGILVAYLVNVFYVRAEGWRWMFGWGLPPALILLTGMFFLPESPAWLHPCAEPKSSRWKEMLKLPTRKILFLGLILSIFQQITGINTVIYYAPKIFQLAGYASISSAVVATLGIGAINVLATLVAVRFLDRWGRRKMLLVGIFGMILCLLVLSGAFFLKSSWIDTFAMASLMGYVAFFALSLGPITWVLLSEIFPLAIRGRAMSLALFANWAFNYLVSLTFLDLVQYFGGEGTFLLYAMISFAAFYFVHRWIPETRGKSLEEIEKSMSRQY